MHVPLKVKVAVAVTLATCVACFFGIRAELKEAERSSAERAPEAKPNWNTTPALATARDE